MSLVSIAAPCRALFDEDGISEEILDAIDSGNGISDAYEHRRGTMISKSSEADNNS
jgi:hypothetical protein